MRSPLRHVLPAICALAAPCAAAEFTDTDLQVAARALSFMEQPLSGRIEVGIVYSPDSPRSRDEAERLKDRLGQQYRAGNLELIPVLVPIQRAEEADVDLFMLTGHVAGGGEALARAAQAGGIPCVTTDVEQVRSGACVMGIQSRPRVEIMVNRKAANESGLRFATAFRVMVTEI